MSITACKSARLASRISFHEGMCLFSSPIFNPMPRRGQKPRSHHSFSSSPSDPSPLLSVSAFSAAPSLSAFAGSPSEFFFSSGAGSAAVKFASRGAPSLSALAGSLFEPFFSSGAGRAVFKFASKAAPSFFALAGSPSEFFFSSGA